MNIMENQNVLSLSPVRDYAPPKYPTFLDAKNDPRLLKKMPSRWRKNMAVFTCMGLVGLTTLGCIVTSCESFHFGGAGGGGPFYVVYLTEQEALALIREKGESAGLDFSAEPPGNIVRVNRNWIGLDLFDEDKGVAVSYIYHPWDADQETATLVREAFSNQNNDFSVGVFYNPGQRAHWSMPAGGREGDFKKGVRRLLNRSSQGIYRMATSGRNYTVVFKRSFIP